jgi:hypothetical protein
LAAVQAAPAGFLPQELPTQVFGETQSESVAQLLRQELLLVSQV